MSAIHSLPASPAADPGRRERKRQQTLDLLAQTACRLFESFGYDAVTMEQIAVEADVAKGTLYNHFPVKEAVLAHWLHLELATNLTMLHEQLESRPRFAEGALFVLDHSADWCETHPDYLAPYLRFRFLGIGTEPSSSRDSEQLSDIADTFDWLIRRGQTSGEIRDDLDPGRLAMSGFAQRTLRGRPDNPVLFLTARDKRIAPNPASGEDPGQLCQNSSTASWAFCPL